MKLSEAIRLGAMIRPQGIDGDSVLHSCALMAALEAVGQRQATYDCWADAERIWPFLLNIVSHPLTGERGELCTMIMGMNDEVHWTRERIADWVSTIELQDAPTLASNGIAEEVAR